MKRLLIVAVAVLLCVQAQAQINIKEVARPEVVASKLNPVSELFEVVKYPADTAAFYCLVVQTNNRYDDRMQIWLGTSTNEALSSLRQLLGLLDEKIGSRYEVELLTGTARIKVSENGTALFPTKNNKTALYISAEGFAGAQVLTRKILESLIKDTERYGKNVND